MSDLVTLASIGKDILGVLVFIVIVLLVILYQVGKYLNSQAHANRVAENQLRVLRGLEPQYGWLERWLAKRAMLKGGQKLNPTTAELHAVGVTINPDGSWHANQQQVQQILANRQRSGQNQSQPGYQALTPQQRCATGAHSWINSDVPDVRVCTRPGCSAVQDLRK